MEPSLTMRELVAEVAEQLARVGAPQDNGRVRAVPDERSIRYYTTIGLLDKPTLRGRTALYGRRHVAQIVAIKRLQSAGRSLEEIQELLPVLDDEALARVSGISASRAARPRARAGFWKASPSRSPEVGPNAAESRTPPAKALKNDLVRRVELAPGVQLSFSGDRELSPRELTELTRAAEPLISFLTTLGLSSHSSRK